MNRPEQLQEVQTSIGEFEERFKNIIISKPQIPGGSRDATPLPVSSEFYRGRIPSVLLHRDLQNTLILKEIQNNKSFRTGVPEEEIFSRDVPRSSKEMTLNFSREEKLLLYDYCIRQTGHHAVQDVPFSYQEHGDLSTASPSSSSKIVTFAEIAALDRKKRKNARQRVPTGSRRRTYTDELRGLIHTQMSAWEAFLREKGCKSRGTKSVKRLQ